jgi:hypothetical protein
VRRQSRSCRSPDETEQPRFSAGLVEQCGAVPLAPVLGLLDQAPLVLPTEPVAGYLITDGCIGRPARMVSGEGRRRGRKSDGLRRNKLYKTEI